MDKIECFTGCLVGLACGDALGGPVEEIPGHPSKVARPVTEMIGGGYFGLLKGQITDDTEMTLCLAESLVEKRGFDIADIAVRYQKWFADNPIGSGKTIEAAIKRLNEGYGWREASWTELSLQSLGNGSVMRCAPLALAFHQSETLHWFNTETEARLTHPHPICVESSLFLNSMIARLIVMRDLDERKRTLEAFNYALKTLSIKSLQETYGNALATDQKPKGNVQITIVAAVRAFMSTVSFEQAVVLAANGGGDADTIAAVTGALAGACYGESKIPDRWKKVLVDRNEKPVYDHLMDLGKSLYNAYYWSVG